MKKIKSYFLFILTIALLSSGIFSCSSGDSVIPNPNPTPNPHPGPSPSVTCSSTERNFLITNSSNEEIWLGVTAGTISCLTDSDCPTSASGSCVGGVPSTGTAGVCNCPTGDECGSVAECNTNNQKCYWNLPSMTKAQMNLASGAQSNICFPAPLTGKNIQWSGNIFARTGCDGNGQNCKTGECGSAANAPCPTGTGGNPPTALAEFTLSNQTSYNSRTGLDFYDISIINGINVGVSMSPTTGTFVAAASNPYSCQSPGSTTASGQLSACNWTITPTVSSTDRTTLLRNVSPTTFTGSGSCPAGGSPNSLGYCTCTTDANCSPSNVCGLAMNAVTGQQYAQVCGTQTGWWTADQICKSNDGTSGTTLDPFDCTVANTDLYSCTGAQSQSCYNDAATATCCGCATSASADNADWPSVLSPNFGGSDNGCYNNNPTWVSIAQPWIVFLKKACPTAYTYPYDDATSTFTCEGSSTTGAPDYDITFLPTH